MYIIYTGNRKERPEEITFSEEFFGGEDICIDARAKIIYDGKEGDIIHQYVTFTKICQEQVSIHGRTRKAIQEAIRICKDRNVLKEYLESKEHDTKVETAKRLLTIGKLSFEEIAIGSGLPIEEVEELADSQLA